MRTKEQYISLLEETIEFYGADPEGRRALNESMVSCMYITRSGEKCAVGRCLEETAVEKLLDYEGAVGDLNSMFGCSLEDNLKPEYRGFPIDYWADLQKLHDTKDYWDYEKGGLSYAGEKAVKNIKRLIDEGIYKGRDQSGWYDLHYSYDKILEVGFVNK